MSRTGPLLPPGAGSNPCRFCRNDGAGLFNTVRPAQREDAIRQFALLVTLALGLAWAELAAVSAQTVPDGEEVAVSATVPETRVSVVGLTSPGALVVVAAQDMIVGVTRPADRQGQFAESFVLSPQSGIMPGEEVVFTLTAEDREGRRASPLERRIRMMLAADNMLDWAILPPTVELSAAVISPSEALTVSGRARRTVKSCFR